MEDISILIDNVKFNFRVGAIMTYKNSVIIEKNHKPTHGVLPGGRVKTLEDIKSALIREIQEEMHFDISNKKIVLQDIIENFFTNNNVKFHELYFVYRIELDDNDELVHRSKEDFINYDAEDSYYEFIDLEQIDKEEIKPYVIKDIVKEKEFNTFVVRD